MNCQVLCTTVLCCKATTDLESVHVHTLACNWSRKATSAITGPAARWLLAEQGHKAWQPRLQESPSPIACRTGLLLALAGEAFTQRVQERPPSIAGRGLLLALARKASFYSLQERPLPVACRTGLHLELAGGSSHLPLWVTQTDQSVLLQCRGGIFNLKDLDDAFINGEQGLFDAMQPPFFDSSIKQGIASGPGAGMLYASQGSSDDTAYKALGFNRVLAVEVFGPKDLDDSGERAGCCSTGHKGNSLFAS